ncbi:hypothetical protein GCK32_021449, partial [Trichostrongylus colubriformis]
MGGQQSSAKSDGSANSSKHGNSNDSVIFSAGCSEVAERPRGVQSFESRFGLKYSKDRSPSSIDISRNSCDKEIPSWMSW